MIKTDDLCIFISSDGFDGSSKLLNAIYEDSKEFDFDKNQIIILTNLGDDIKFATTYPEFEYIICNKPDEENTKLEDRFNCALNFINTNKIKDYVLILDK